MPKKKAQVDSDVEDSDDSELHEVKREAMKVTAASTRPRRATASAVQKLTKKLMEGSDEESEEDEFPTIAKTTLAKYKDSVNAAPGTVHVIRKDDVDSAMLKALKVSQWPVWASKTGGWPDCNVPYEYEHEIKELSLFLEGSCTVTPDGGEPVQLHVGDFAVFPKNLVCTWTILEPVKKHYIELK